MTAEEHDRRALRTQAALIHALLALIATKHYDQITVRDIVRQANVGRSTFYAHYQSKDDLLVSGFEQQLDVLVRQIVISEDGRLQFDTTAFFRHVQGHCAVYRTLIWGSGFKLLIKDGHAALATKIEARLSALLALHHPPKVPLPVLANTLSGVLLVLLKWWLDNQMPYSAERMDEIFQKLMMPGASAVLGM